MKGFEILKDVLGFAREGEIKWKICFKDAEEAIECGIMYLGWGAGRISWAKSRPESFWDEFRLSWDKKNGIVFLREGEPKDLSTMNWKKACEEVSKIDSKLDLNNENYVGRVGKWNNGCYVKVKCIHDENGFGAFDVLDKNGIVVEEDVLMRVVKDSCGYFEFYRAGVNIGAPENEGAVPVEHECKVLFKDIDLSSSYILCESKDQVERVLSFFNPYSQKAEDIGIHNLFRTDLYMVFKHEKGWISGYMPDRGHVNENAPGMSEVRAENILGVDPAPKPEKKEENSFKIPKNHYISFQNEYEVYEYIENNFIDSAPKETIKMNVRHLIKGNSKMPGFCCEEIRDWTMGFGYGYEIKYKEITYEDYLKMKNSSPAQEFFDMLRNGIPEKEEKGHGIDYRKYIGRKMVAFEHDETYGKRANYPSCVGAVGTIIDFIEGETLNDLSYIVPLKLFKVKFPDRLISFFPADKAIESFIVDEANNKIVHVYDVSGFVPLENYPEIKIKSDGLDSLVITDGKITSEIRFPKEMGDFKITPRYKKQDPEVNFSREPEASFKSDSISHGDFFVVKGDNPDYDKIKKYVDLLELARKNNSTNAGEVLSFIHDEIYKNLNQ